ncbi:MAG: ArsA family ATPase [Nannocystis sp.]|nr:ArsA-related P-loop ATPase [Nannocystis sp.]MBA3548020.1 ArsA family ATPase [Nannocystis sp.]
MTTSTTTLARLLDRRLLLFTGKGGVGKSTVVAALATEAARRGQRPLIVELGHRASMQSIFEVPHIGHEPIAVSADGKVWAANLDLDEAIVDYVVEQVKIRRVARSIIGNRTLQGLFRAAPAVREVAMLNKLRLFEREQTKGRPRWGPILVDLDATGHALMLLDMPQILGSLLSGGPLRGLIDTLTGLFTDPSRTLLNLVTLPAEIPVQETLELHERIVRGGGIQLGALFINQVPPPPLAAELRPLLPELTELAAHAGLAELTHDLGLASHALGEDAQVRGLITTLHREVRMPLALLPRLDPSAPDALPTLGRAAMLELALPSPPSLNAPEAWAAQEGA